MNVITFPKIDPSKIRIIERFAMAGDPDDCGHERPGPKGGKFEKGNTCAAGGGSSGSVKERMAPSRTGKGASGPSGAPKDRSKSDKVLAEASAKVSPKRFQVVPDDLIIEGIKNPNIMKDRLQQGDLDKIDSLKTLNDMKELYKIAYEEAGEGILPTIKETIAIAKIGISTKGQYEWTGNMMKDVLGEKRASIWAALNAVMSPQHEYREHTIGSMRLLRHWIESGSPTHIEGIGKLGTKGYKPGIEDVIDKLEAEERPSTEKGAPPEKMVHLYGGAKKFPVVHDGIVRVLTNSEKWKDMEQFINVSAGGITKTKEFYNSWFKPGSFAFDKWMSKILKTPGMSDETIKQIIDTIDAQGSTPDKLTPASEALFKDITDAKERLGIAKEAMEKITKEQVSAPGKTAPYLAYKATAAEAAARLTKETGEEWSEAEVQESAWSALIAISTLKYYGYTNKQIPDALTHQMVSQSWDIQGLLSDERFKEDIRAVGIPERINEDFSSWEKYSGKKQPPKQGRINPSNRRTVENIAGRLPKLGHRTVEGKSVFAPVSLKKGREEVEFKTKFSFDDEINRYMASRAGRLDRYKIDPPSMEYDPNETDPTAEPKRSKQRHLPMVGSPKSDPAYGPGGSGNVRTSGAQFGSSGGSGKSTKSGSDCGHEPSGTPRAGKFAKGNTCASKHRGKRSIKEFTKQDKQEFKQEVSTLLASKPDKTATAAEIREDLGFTEATDPGGKSIHDHINDPVDAIMEELESEHKVRTRFLDVFDSIGEGTKFTLIGSTPHTRKEFIQKMADRANKRHARERKEDIHDKISLISKKLKEHGVETNHNNIWKYLGEEYQQKLIQIAQEDPSYKDYPKEVLRQTLGRLSRTDRFISNDIDRFINQEANKIAGLIFTKVR